MTLSWDEEISLVEMPDESKKGWNFPYAGGEWPTIEDWYWVFAPKHSDNSPTNTPSKLWWDSKKMRFLAVDEERVLAWREYISPTKAQMEMATLARAA